MRYLETAAWLAWMAANPLVWPLAVVLLAAAAVQAIRRRAAWRQEASHRSAPLLFLPSLLTLLILLSGAVFQADRFHPSQTGSTLIGLFALLEVTAAGWCVWRFRRVWHASVPLVLAQVWYGTATALVSGMSVSGNWL